MSRATTAACRRNRADLLVLLEDPLGSGLSQSARAHLDDCGDCRTELGALALAARRLRQAIAAPVDAEPAVDAWPRLRARVVRHPSRPGRASSSVLGLAVGASLAVALLLPIGALRFDPSTATPTPAVFHEAGLDPAAIIAAGLRDAAGEARHLREIVLAGKESAAEPTNNSAREALIRMETALQPDLRSRAPRSYAASVE